MKNSLTLSIVGTIGICVVLGCGGSTDSGSSSPATAANTGSRANATPTSSDQANASSEKPIALKAVQITKEYDENELAADGKYKGKLLAVSGKISNIAETLGNVTVHLDGHDIVQDVMCSFEEPEEANVAKLKKGQQVTLVGIGDGRTLGLYVGLNECRIQ